MRGVKNVRLFYSIISCLCIALGLCLILWPELSVKTVVTVAGIVLGVYGIIKIFSYFYQDAYRLAFQFDLGMGIVMTLAGLLMVLYPAKTAAILPFVVGCLLLLDSALKLQTAIDAKKFGMDNWLLLLIMAIVTIVCSILLIINPFSGALALAWILGICLIADGVQNLYSVLSSVRKK
jgi:uncharacterized membrane protein HdeD (DUF308 family)